MNADRAPAAERPRSVFGRLRDVSRSNTRSGSRTGSVVFGSGYGGDGAERKSPGPSRSVSRAASLVFGQKDTETAPPMPVPALDTTAPAPAPGPLPILTSPVAASPGVMPGPEDRRREMWEDDGAEVADAGWREEDGRLGVLPSPSVQESVGPASPGKARKGSWIGEPVEEPLEERRGEEDAEEGDALEKARGGEGWMLGPAANGAGAMVSTEGSGLVQPSTTTPLDPTTMAMDHNGELPSASRPDARRSSLGNVKVRDSVKHTQTRSASYAPTAPTEPRPQPERKFSALDQLPSQQRRRQFTPVATPRRMSLADDAAPALEPMPNYAAMPTPADTSRAHEDPRANPDFLADVRSTPMKASRPATPANWDQLSVVSAPKGADDAASRRSSVSSLGNPQSPDTVIIPGAASKRQSIIGMPTSTLDSKMEEQERNVSPLPFQVSAVPTMEPDSMIGGARPQDDPFANRGYRSSQQTEQRPMSYAAHSRGSSSVMMPDYSAAGAVSYQQQQQPQSVHSLSRAPSIIQPPSEYDKLRSPQAGDTDPIVGESSSKRSSGFFRGPDLAPGAIPSPSKLDANYDGLVDPQVSDLADEIVKAEQQQPQKRRKSGLMDSFRRSSTYSSANASRPSSRGSFSKVTASNGNESSLAKSKTLKKPQRAPSAAVEPPKNKRFSSLGSLFRRSSTMTPRTSAPPAGSQTGSQASKSNAASPVVSKPSKKLTKTQPPQQQQQYSQQLQQQYAQRPGSYYTSPPPGNYAAYEAMRQQQGQMMPPQYWQQQPQQQHQPMYAEPAMVSSPYQPQAATAPSGQRQSGYYQQGPPQAPYQQHPPTQQYQTSVPNSRTHSLVGSPASERSAPLEYYGNPQGLPQQSAQPRPQARRLHSEGHRRRDTVPGIPEANSPVDPSNGFAVAPARSYTDGQIGAASAQGSPQQAQPMPSRPTVDTRQSSTYSQASVIRSPAMAQAPDNFPQAPGRQDYQTQYWQHHHRPQREPTLPQLQTQAPPANLPATSVGSIDQQMARSPALDYQDQQTPWSINLPQESSNRHSNTSSWTQQPPSTQSQQQYRGAPAAARGAVRSQSPPRRHQDQYSSMTPYQFVPPQQMQNMAPQGQQQRSSMYGEQVSSPTTYTTSSPQQMSSPATYSPVSPQGHEYSSPEQYHHAYGHSQQQRGPPPQNRYYSQGAGAPRSAGPQRQINPNDEDRPLSYQRTPSGYSGRRDDAAVSEAELMNMRSTSYPGQEWAPGRN